MSEQKKGEGMMAGAPPTAPGGMSQKALAEELLTEHGWSNVDNMPWPAMIDAVAQGRLDREREREEFGEHTLNPNDDLLVSCGPHDLPNCAECNGTAKAHDKSLKEPHMFEVEGAAMFDPAADTLDDIDPDDLMAELVYEREEQETYRIQHGLLIKEPGTFNYIFDGHAGAGPSGSERWMHCTASLQASREFLETLTPNQQEQYARANLAARQGTTAHSAAEVEARVILGEMGAEEAALTMIELAALPDTDDESYNEEMGEYITEYVDLVKSYAQERGNENVLIEERVEAAVPLTGLHEGEVYVIEGSTDCGVMPTPEHPMLVAADLKYGSGIWVDADENSQARIYALGLLGRVFTEYGGLPGWLTEVTLHIVQPRIDGIKTFTESVDDLLTWRDEVLAPALTKALYGVPEGATFEPSETACQFCPARGGCAALAEVRIAQAADFFDVQVDAEFNDGPGAFPETTSLTDTRLGELLAQIGGLIDIHKDLKAEAERRLYRGDAVPGFHLVNYSPPRKWKEGADEAFEEVPEVWSKKLITPTQAVKIAEASPEEWDIDSLNDWIDKPDKRPVVAKEGDRRSKWEGKPPEAMFDVEEEA